jgi:hypothetical protein
MCPIYGTIRFVHQGVFRCFVLKKVKIGEVLRKICAVIGVFTLSEGGIAATQFALVWLLAGL